MKVKTVSRLPEAINIGNEDLFQLSRKVDGYDNRYNSVKIKYETVLSSVYDIVDDKISEKYSLEEDTIGNINQSLENNNKNIFKLSDDVILNKERIEDLEEITPEWDIKNMDSYIIPSSRDVVRRDHMMIFNFSDRDNPQITTSNIIPRTGNLFCYGWITAPKVIDPANAWVAIETKLNDNNWAMIALQPWIIGDKSSVMQYVGFNCPVQENMQIRIRTGFQITDFSQSFSGRGLVLNIGSQSQGSNINNSFIGYILGGDEN